MSSTLLFLLLASAPAATGLPIQATTVAYTVRCESNLWPTHGQVERLLQGASPAIADTPGATRERQVARVHRQIREQGSRACRAGATHVEVRLPADDPAPVGGRVAARARVWPTA